MNEDILMLIMIPMLLAALPLAIHSFLRVYRLERREIRQQYTDLMLEKLEIIKSAIAMGHTSDEIADLDERLEKLIGTEKMLETLRSPTNDALQQAEHLDAMDTVEELEEESMPTKKKKWKTR